MYHGSGILLLVLRKVTISHRLELRRQAIIVDSGTRQATIAFYHT